MKTCVASLKTEKEELNKRSIAESLAAGEAVYFKVKQDIIVPSRSVTEDFPFATEKKKNCAGLDADVKRHHFEEFKSKLAIF